MADPIDRVALEPEHLGPRLRKRHFGEGVATAETLDEEEPGQEKVRESRETKHAPPNREHDEDERHRQDLEGPGRLVRRSQTGPDREDCAERHRDGEDSVLHSFVRGQSSPPGVGIVLAAERGQATINRTRPRFSLRRPLGNHSAMTDSDQSNRSVLVVDDDPIMRRLVVRGLEPLGFARILEAEDGIPAKAMLQAGGIDLVVTDLVMPGLDGLGLMRWAQDNAPGPDWIILSGVETFDAAVDAIHLGAFEFLSKPPEVKMLQVVARNALNHRDLLQEKERLLDELQSSSVELLDKVRELEHKSQVIRADLERAELIQRALLPQSLPDLPGVSVHTLYRPGRNVGGDLYDVATIGDHTVFYVADATGHGVAAAMLSVLFKQRLEMRNGDGRAASPAAVLGRVNEHLRRDIQAPGMFLTAAYCVLEPATNELRIASAGHPPILVARADGAREWIERTGPALGLESGATYAERSITLSAGDRVLLYTDGLIDGCADATQGQSELADNVAVERANTAGRLRALFDGATARLEAIDQGAERDDITMLLVEAGSGESGLDNGARGDASREQTSPSPRTDPADDAVIWLAEDEASSVLRVQGRGTWTHSDAFFRVACRTLDAGRALRIDLSACEHLDSAFLGTIHEIVRRDTDKTSLHEPSATLRQLFDELCMADVAQKIEMKSAGGTASLHPVRASDPSAQQSQKRLLRAHEILASLSDRNRDKFQPIVDALRAELGDAG